MNLKKKTVYWFLQSTLRGHVGSILVMEFGIVVEEMPSISMLPGELLKRVLDLWVTVLDSFLPGEPEP